MKYKGKPAEAEAGWDKTAVLLTNLGSPDAPTASALRRYLAEFLWDQRVVELSRPLWWLILHGIILRFRPAKSAKAYQSVWTEQGAPLLSIARRQQQALQHLLAQKGLAIPVALGMRYGNPSIASALEQLREQQVGRIIVLPLYPQYAAATVATSFDAVFDELKHWRRMPQLTTIGRYCEFPAYIEALAQGVEQYWQQNGRPDKLLFSFHGVPKRYVDNGDPYRRECEKTVALLVKRLGLQDGEYLLTFQSRFGKEEYLQPYTDETVKALGKQGLGSLAVICPGFSADCLETIEEINEENRHYFLDAGGKKFDYIPALNDSPAFINALSLLLEPHLNNN